MKALQAIVLFGTALLLLLKKLKATALPPGKTALLYVKKIQEPYLIATAAIIGILIKTV